MKQCSLFLFLLSASLVFSSNGAENSPSAGEGPSLDRETVKSGPQIFKSRKGPWGQLEYYYTHLEAPDSLVKSVPTPSSEIIWHLPGKTREEQRKLLESAGMLASQVDAIFDNSNPSDEGAALFPPPDVIAELSQEVRGRVYRTLRSFPENPLYRTPLVMNTDDVHQWFSGGQLTSETLDLVDLLSYPIGNTLAFSDVPFLLQQSSMSERMERNLIRSMTRTRSLILRLRIDRDSDLAQIKEYWTAGFKNKDVLPLLNSVSQSPEIDYIDVIHLLPPIPRQHLNTFPSLAEGIDGSYPDSFWAAMNFFEYLPRSEFKDLRQVARYAEFAYEPANKPLRYGDLLVIYDPERDLSIQAAVYLADYIVYTKDGRSVLRPFILTRLPDLVSRFQGEIPFEVRAWRKRSRY